MREPSHTPDEPQRMQSLRNLNILDTPAEERFDRLTRLAKKSLGTEIALISLIDADRQWFKSATGLTASETGRAISFCGHAIHQGEIFHVPDATKDERFFDNPLVTGAPHIRLYAAKPVRAPDGKRIGTLCVIDPEPRELDDEDRMALEDLAHIVEDELRTAALGQSEQSLRARLTEAERRAAIDGLTRIWNREIGMRILKDEISRSSREGHALSVLMVDLDHFKQVNDTHGHLAGDTVLQEVADRMRGALRSYDTLCRYGGEEFMVVLPSCDGELAQSIASRLLSHIRRRPVSIGSNEIQVRASAGVCTATPRGALDPATLIEGADRALYVAKADGRDRWVMNEKPLEGVDPVVQLRRGRSLARLTGSRTFAAAPSRRPAAPPPAAGPTSCSTG